MIILLSRQKNNLIFKSNKIVFQNSKIQNHKTQNY